MKNKGETFRSLAYIKAINELKKYKLDSQYDSLKSEYIDDIINSLGDDSLQELLNKWNKKNLKRHIMTSRSAYFLKFSQSAHLLFWL